MTFDDFKAKHKENVLKGFDDIDGRDYWAEFKADLHTLLADERKALDLQLDEARKVILVAHSAINRMAPTPCTCDWCKAGKKICEHRQLSDNAVGGYRFCADCNQKVAEKR